MNISFERNKSKEDWITPPEIVEALGTFDLDPCSSHFQKQPYAKKQYYIEDNSLEKEWYGRVWLNPPYGTKTQKFVKKLSEHGNGIALIFTRVDTKLWHEVIFRYADAIFILKGRLKFYDTEGNEGDSAGAGSAFIAFGKDNVTALENSGFKGHFIYTK